MKSARGKTFLRLIKAYQAVNPALRKVFIVCLVNFAHPDDRAALNHKRALRWNGCVSGRVYCV